ncbi:MAG: hypothetical protein JXR77_02480 [Lentisphaeria bacterium]|nr:hypothetical protein [Lentisphaeria bacterium]
MITGRIGSQFLENREWWQQGKLDVAEALRHAIREEVFLGSKKLREETLREFDRFIRWAQATPGSVLGDAAHLSRPQSEALCREFSEYCARQARRSHRNRIILWSCVALVAVGLPIVLALDAKSLGLRRADGLPVEWLAGLIAVGVLAEAGTAWVARIVHRTVGGEALRRAQPTIAEVFRVLHETWRGARRAARGAMILPPEIEDGTSTEETVETTIVLLQAIEAEIFGETRRELPAIIQSERQRGAGLGKVLIVDHDAATRSEMVDEIRYHLPGIDILLESDVAGAVKQLREHGADIITVVSTSHYLKSPASFLFTDAAVAEQIRGQCVLGVLEEIAALGLAMPVIVYAMGLSETMGNIRRLVAERARVVHKDDCCVEAMKVLRGVAAAAEPAADRAVAAGE